MMITRMRIRMSLNVEELFVIDEIKFEIVEFVDDEGDEFNCLELIET